MTELRSLSAAAGWMACGSFEKDTSPPGPAAVLGTEAHSVLEAGIAGDEMRGASPAAGRLGLAALGWLGETAGLVPEVAYAIAPSGDVRQLGSRIGRAYAIFGANPGDICGSADVVGPGLVVDLKTGREASWEKHEAQMRALGYCVAKSQGRDRVRCVVLHVTPRAVMPHERELDALDLAAIGHELATARALPLVPRPGNHCDSAYCGARPRCGAYLALRGAA